MAKRHVQKAKPKKRASAALVRRATKTSARQFKTVPEPSSTQTTARKGLGARGVAILSAAAAAGYLRGDKTERIGGRVTRKLLSAAKASSGLKSQTELLEYALSTVALEDGYGEKLLARKGSVPRDIEL